MTASRSLLPRWLILPGLAASAALAACSDIARPVSDPLRYGAISFVATNGPNGTANAVANVSFLTGYAVVPNSAALATDQCVPSVVDTTTPIVRGQFGAGDSIAVAIGTRSFKLPYRMANLRYETTTGAPISYTAGEVAQVTIPGADTAFPSSSISIKLAERLVPGPVALPQTAGAPLVVTWNATNDSTAAVLVFLRYATTQAGTFANEQIYCQLRDDGRAEIPSSVLTTFLTSPIARRSLRMVRYRTNVQQLDARTILHAASQVDTVVTVFQ